MSVIPTTVVVADGSEVRAGVVPTGYHLGKAVLEDRTVFVYYAKGWHEMAEADYQRSLEQQQNGDAMIYLPLNAQEISSVLIAIRWYCVMAPAEGSGKEPMMAHRATLSRVIERVEEEVEQSFEGEQTHE